MRGKLHQMVCETAGHRKLPRNRMKIAHLMIGNGWGGVQSFFRDCCIEMSNRGHTILAVVRIDGWLHQVMSDHADNFKLAAVSNQFGNYDWSTVRQFRQILNQFDPDIVVSHGQRSTVFANKVKSTDNSRWPQVSLVQASLKEKYYKGVDLLIPHTKSQADIEYHVDLVNPNFSEVIPLFASIDPVRHAEKKSPIRKLFSAGRLHTNKGYTYLIDAMHNLFASGHNLQLTIAGDGPEMRNLVRQRDSLGLKNSIHFIGATDNVIPLMKSADLFVLPSIDEHFGIVLLEAMASGLSIVATKTNGPMEIFDNTTAVLVDKNSATALSEGIRSAIQDPQASFQRACNALNSYKERYTADVVVPKLIGLFQRCIEQRNRVSIQP